MLILELEEVLIYQDFGFVQMDEESFAISGGQDFTAGEVDILKITMTGTEIESKVIGALEKPLVNHCMIYGRQTK